MCLRRTHAWLLVLFCLDATALADLVTGSDLWLGPVYLLVICLASWSMGWRAGQGVGVACMALTFALNGLSLYPHAGADLAWDVASRFVAISLVIALVSGARRAYVREWWFARTDPLTGALNRQAFFELGASLAKGRDWRLMIYADLDGLKQLNDDKGHAEGDACLSRFASVVRKSIRRDDLFARVGGDEFVLFMAVGSEAAANAVASRLHQAMNSVQRHGGATLRCSVGALIVPPGEVTLDALVRRSDRLMYQAKQRGGCLETDMAADGGHRQPSGRARTVPRAALAGAPADEPVPYERRASLGELRARRSPA